MSDAAGSRVPEPVLFRDRRVMWDDELAKYKGCARGNLRRTIANERSKSPDAKKLFVDNGARVGVTRSGFHLIEARWPEDKRAAVDQRFSEVRSEQRRTTQAAARAAGTLDVEAEIIQPEPKSQPGTWLTYNKVPIRDRDEMLNLTDMWRAAGSDPSKAPYEWSRKEGSAFIEFLADNLNALKGRIYQTERGVGGGTWAHWQIALAYAKYLSPEFHVACNEVIRDHMEGNGRVQQQTQTQDIQLTPAVAAAIATAMAMAMQPFMTELRDYRTELREHRQTPQSGRARPSDLGFDPPPQPITTKKRGQTSLRPFATLAKGWLRIRMPLQQIMAFLEDRLVAQKWAERNAPPNAYTRGNLLATPEGYESGYVINYQATRPSDGSVFPMALNLTKEGADYCMDMLREEFLTPSTDDRQSDFFNEY